MNPIRDEWQSPDGSVRLLLGDCLEILPTLEVGIVEAVVTDPPYPNMKGGYDWSWSSNLGIVSNESISLGDPWSASLEWISLAIHIAEFASVVFCSYHSVAEVFVKHAGMRPVALLTWYKRNAPPTGKNVPRFTSEFAWCFAKKPGMSWDRLTGTVLDVPKLDGGCCASERMQYDDGTPVHPTQKPIRLMQDVMVFNPDSVLDPFMGSGTTGVACIRTQRRFIGIEISEQYFRIAVERCKRELGRFPLFEQTRPKQAELFSDRP